MALITRKEFAEKCGVNPDYLTQYIKRGKVILTNNKIDTENELNIYFMQTRWLLTEKKGNDMPTLKIDVPEIEAPEGEYNLQAEEKMADVMFEFMEENKPFPVVPVCLVITLIREGFVEVYQRMLNREVEILKQNGTGLSNQHLSKLVKWYSEQCASSITICCNDIQATVDGIINDYVTKE